MPSAAIVLPPSRKDGRRGKPQAATPRTNSTGRAVPVGGVGCAGDPLRWRCGGEEGELGVTAARVRFHPELPGRTTRGAGENSSVVTSS
jgi:hypothetical protein